MDLTTAGLQLGKVPGAIWLLARAAREVADYGYVLEMGEIALQGRPAELANDPRVIEPYPGAARKKAFS